MTDKTTDAPVAKPFLVYADDQRRKLYDAILRLRYGPFEPGQKRATWEAIAESIGIARSTLQEWRELDDYKQAEVRYRKLMREEGRTSASGMGQEALDHIRYLMLNARSDFVQLEAAKQIIQITNMEKELEEAQLDANHELIELQKVLLKRKLARARLREAGFDPGKVIDAQVKDGGFLPDVVQAENRIVAERLALEAGEDDPDPDGI